MRITFMGKPNQLTARCDVLWLGRTLLYGSLVVTRKNKAVLSSSSSFSFSFLELGGRFDLPDRGTAKNRNRNVNRDQRSKSEVENDDEGRGRLGKEARRRPVP